MTKLLDVQPSLRRGLAEGLAQARSALKRSGAHFLAPSFPGMTGAGDCRLLPGPSLDELLDEGFLATTVRWPEQALVATHWPVLLFVLEGECDMRFGVTEQVRRHAPALPSKIAQYIAPAREGQFLLFPSHVPRPDGDGIHWERPDTESAASSLMWFSFFPTGCFVHFCKTEGREHSQSKSIYLAAPRTFRLLEEVEGEVLGAQPQWQAAVRRYLEIILLLLQRDPGSVQIAVGTTETARQTESGDETAPRPPHLVLQHACHFIEERLQEPLRAPQIAAAAGVAAPRLNQLFRQHLQTTIAQYVIRRRIECASTLLCETNLAVSLIAEQSGFAHLEHFSRTFRRAAGLSPLAYRKRHQQVE